MSQEGYRTRSHEDEHRLIAELSGLLDELESYVPEARLPSLKEDIEQELEFGLNGLWWAVSQSGRTVRPDQYERLYSAGMEIDAELTRKLKARFEIPVE